MSAPVVVNHALIAVDALIASVAAIDITPAAASSSSSLMPTTTKDKRWWPIVPAGHTAYTFYGVTDASSASSAPAAAAAVAAPVVVAAPVAAAPTPAAAPAASSSSSSAPPAKAPKAAKPAKAAAVAVPVVAAEDMNQPDFTKLDIRVGQIVSAARHPKPEVLSLYVEQIDVGEAAPRQIVSGLVKYIPLDVFSTSRVCVICNLKPSPLQGVVSNGMVLAASRGEGDARIVELIQPPVGSMPGDRIILTNGAQGEWMPMASVDPRKTNKLKEMDNAWARVAVDLKTNDNKEATWKGQVLGTPTHGAATSATLANVNIA